MKRLFVTLSILYLTSTVTLDAGSASWNITSSGNWNTASNWTPATVPNGASDVATFPDLGVNDLDITMNTDITLDSISITAKNFTILGTGHLTLDSTVDKTVGEYFIFDPANLTLADGIVLNAGGNASARLVFATETLVASNITKNGNGILEFNSNTNYPSVSGTITANSGQIRTLNAARLNANVNINLAGSSANLQLSGNATQTIGTLTGVSGSSVNIPNNKELRVNSTSDSEFAGVIEGVGTFNKRGTETLTLSGACTNTGDWEVEDGTLDLTGSIQTTAMTISGGKLKLSASGTFGNDATITMSSDGDLEINNSSVTIKELTGASTNTLTLNANTLTIDQSTDTTFAGVASGTNGGITKIGSGTLTLSGTNTYTGTTTLSQGGLTITGSIASNSISVTQGTLTLNSANPVPTTSTITISGSGVFDLSSSATIGKISASSGSVDLGANTLTITETGTDTFAGVFSGTGGGLTKSGSGTLTLSGTNTYTGATTVSDGTLVIGSGGTGSVASSSIAVTAGTLQLATSSPVGNTSTLTLSGTSALNVTSSATIGALVGSSTNTGSLSDGTTLTVTETGTNTFAGAFSGAGGLTKTGTGTLTLTGDNTYTGNTTLSQGTLAIGSAGSGSVDSETISITTGTLSLGSSAPVLTSSTIALTGDGVATIDNSTVTIGAITASGASNTLSLGANTLVMNPSTSTTFAGVIQGTGNLTKEGTSTLTLSATNLYSGNTLINAGTLVVTGAIASGSTTTIGSSATLKGTGSTGPIQNNGTFAPGLSIGTVTITGDYIQDASANLEIEINPDGSSDLLDVSGDVQLAGTLTVLPETGTYNGGETYTFIEFDGTLTGNFDSIVESHAQDFSVTINANTVVLNVINPLVVLPVSISNLRGNSKEAAEYLFGDNFSPTGSDFSTVSNALIGSPVHSFARSLVKMTPLIFGALPVVNFQNDIRIGSTFIEEFKKYCHFNRQEDLKEGQHSFSPQRPNGLWMDPIGVYYNQNASNGRLSDLGQAPFVSYTYGTSAGYDCQLDYNLTFCAAGGYTHTTIYWEGALGDGYWNSAYFGPSLGWDNGNSYITAVLLTSFNFYNLRRNIHILDLDRTASHRHNSYDVLVQLACGAVGRCGQSAYLIQPEAEFNFVNVYQKGFNEDGAGAANLQVKSKDSVFFQPNFKVRLMREFKSDKHFFTPSVYAGWLANIIASNGIYTSRLIQEQTNRRRMKTQTYRGISNQLDLGIEGLMESCYGLSASVNYDVNFLSLYQIHQLKVKFQWDF